jgi:hypothetical protein
MRWSVTNAEFRVDRVPYPVVGPYSICVSLSSSVFQEIVAPLAVRFEALTPLITGFVVSELAETATVAEALIVGFDAQDALTV